MNQFVHKGGFRQLAVAAAAVALIIVPWLWRPAARLAVTTAFASSGSHRTYATDFRYVENPISEGGKWISGRAAAFDWADVRTTPGFAFGTELAVVTTAPRKYDDSVALVAGSWGPNQSAEATVRTKNQNENIWEEVELRLRSTLSPHRATGYEINFRCGKTGKAYHEIVRWNGPLGSFTYLKQTQGAQYGVADGDVVKATMVGNVITTYRNGVQMLQITDDSFTSGSPGIGFYLEGATGVNADYGFTNFKAAEE